MKWLSGVGLALVVVLWGSSAAVAGGWAVTTLDALPGAVQAGQTYRIGYMIRQHGVTPVTQAQPRVRISLAGEELGFDGRAEGAPGHYVSDVTFPKAGAWTWVVDQTPFPEPQKLGAVTVEPAPAGALVDHPIPAMQAQPPVELAMAALVALLLVAVALAMLRVKRLATP